MADKGLMAPGGNIVLVVGSAAQEIRVSSDVLFAASPVFKTILNPPLQEGKPPRSGSEPVKIPLPEDDPNAMFVLCHLLHLDSFNASDNFNCNFVKFANFGILVGTR
ncbi:hypothetical protein CKM354_000898900 [Cercospora kikuchii]|uniref:BTB domain-containing protein n=1 Tax=Cercospora kikuchii TaxID=84275 RepID=A0A9P3FJR3_9PEZI|nr:uncharacterized protein CKM354_000898900 [Cercospora kikuchii]GIZ45839.1 hypothetical protein CKM354_000898900 [Cercospora kikuchii]